MSEFGKTRKERIRKERNIRKNKGKNTEGKFWQKKKVQICGKRSRTFNCFPSCEVSEKMYMEAKKIIKYRSPKTHGIKQ